MADSENAKVSVAAKISVLDRYLTLWVLAAMALGVAIGWLFPDVDSLVKRTEIDGVSVPIFLGLLAMMYPVFLKVRYERVRPGTIRLSALLVLSLVLTWGVGPLIMYVVAHAMLPDLPHYRTGLILVGIAPCIGMVLVWNMLAEGDNELAAVLVALNSIIQVFFFSVLGWFYLTLLPRWTGGESAQLQASTYEIAKSVVLFLGIPLMLGYTTRRILLRRRGQSWYEERFLPRIGKIPLAGLLYTIVLTFTLQGEKIVQLPLDVLRIALPLVTFFFVAFFTAFSIARLLGHPYRENAAIAFTASSNNFELAIAVAIAVWGVTSPEALATTVGPLIEIPVLMSLVYVSLWLRRRFSDDSPER